MHLCFVDESGTPAKPGRDRPKFFVIAGLIVPEERWHVLYARVRGLKTRKKYRGEFKWRYFAPDNTDFENPMARAKWDQTEKNAVRDEIFTIITSDKGIRIVAGVCEQELAYKLPTISSQEDIYFHTYKVVTERFQYFLQDVSKTGGRKTLGIIVGDHRGKGDDDNLRIQHQRLITESKQYTSTYENLVEGLFLAPSHLSIGIQLVDMVAGAIWRRFEAGDAKWTDQITASFRTDGMGKIDGYGIARFPKAGWSGPVL